MSSRTLVTLLIALSVLTALAIAVSFSQRAASGAGEMLVPGLKARLNEVERITVRVAGGKTVATLVRGEQGWVIAEREDHPADMGRIRRTLIALAEARILEEKTANPEFYDRLGVEDITGEAASGTELAIGTRDATTTVIIGRTGVGGGDRAYARRATEATSWLVNGSFDLARDTDPWLDRALLDIAPRQIRALTISHPDGSTLRITKDTAEAADFTVADRPADRELSFPTAANTVVAAIEDLTFERVEAASGFDPGDARPIVARFETFDGLVIDISTWKLAGGERVRITASASDAQQAGEAQRLAARFGGWVYTLPDYKGEQLTRRLADLLEPLPPGK
jgi:hypothetical protein